MTLPAVLPTGMLMDAVPGKSIRRPDRLHSADLMLWGWRSTFSPGDSSKPNGPTVNEPPLLSREVGLAGGVPGI